MLHIVRQTKILALCGVLAVLTSLTACGQKGPLYLPAPAPSPAQQSHNTPTTGENGQGVPATSPASSQK